MKTIHSMIAALALAFVLPAAADAATTDPEVIIYRFPGVRDDGSADLAGVATVFHCTNFSGVTEGMRFVTRTFDGTLKTNVGLNIDHLATITRSTHHVAAYPSLTLATGPTQGTTAIAATSTNIICTAVTIDAANAKPDGVALRGIRFSPVPGSQE
jgi:hypothetical protein